MYNYKVIYAPTVARLIELLKEVTNHRWNVLRLFAPGENPESPQLWTIIAYGHPREWPNEEDLPPMEVNDVEMDVEIDNNEPDPR